MNHEDPQTYKRGTHAALLGLLVQTVFLALLGGLAFALGTAGLTAAAWYAGGGLLLWLTLALLYSQHRMERLEALETEQLARTHGSDSSIFQTSADDLSVARRRVLRLQRWGLPLVSLITALYLAGVGLWLLVSNAQRLTLLNLPKTSLLPGSPLFDKLADLYGKSATFQNLPQLAGLTIEEPILYLSLLAGLALIGFVASRYVAGMGSVKQWQLLRGGAGYLMGNALVALLLAAAFGLQKAFDSALLLKYLMVIIPAVMIVIGIEIALNLVLEIYRPRKPGEVPRPAFDSRLLSLLTTPESIAKTIHEAINYQFGFEITRSWFFQMLSKAFGYLVLLGALVLVGLSSIVVIAPHEQAVLTRFGALQGREPLGPGLHFKWPWPIDRANTYDVRRIRTVRVGSDIELLPDVPILWTNEHARITPQHLIVAPAALEHRTDERQADSQDKPSKTPSVSLVNAEIDVDYHIGDLLRYVRSTGRMLKSDRQLIADRLLKDIAEREVSRYLYTRDIDAWIGAGRIAAGTELTRRIQRAAADAKLGLVVDGVRLKSIHPPMEQEVAQAFHETVGAQQEKVQRIQEARKKAIEALAKVAGSADRARGLYRLIEQLDRRKDAGADEAQIIQLTGDLERELFRAGGEAARTIAEARAYRWQRENVERAAATRFEKELLGYRAAPRLYATRRYLEVLTDGLKQQRKYLLLADRDELILRFDFKDLSGMGSFPIDEMEQAQNR